MGLIKALGLDGRILLAQLVNFSILIFVLWRFAYKPVLGILEERRLKVEKSLDDVEEAALRLENASAESKQILIKSRQEALRIIEQAQVQAELRQKEVVRQAEENIGTLMNKEREKIALEKEASLQQLKQELSALVLASLQKFLGENLNNDRDQVVVNKIVKDLGNS
jgi:F-type H+-transporting ATPase subunit b